MKFASACCWNILFVQQQQNVTNRQRRYVNQHDWTQGVEDRRGTWFPYLKGVEVPGRTSHDRLRTPFPNKKNILGCTFVLHDKSKYMGPRSGRCPFLEIAKRLSASEVSVTENTSLVSVANVLRVALNDSSLLTETDRLKLKRVHEGPNSVINRKRLGKMTGVLNVEGPSPGGPSGLTSSA